jgi:hypothetical protein
VGVEVRGYQDDCDYSSTGGYFRVFSLTPRKQGVQRIISEIKK